MKKAKKLKLKGTSEYKGNGVYEVTVKTVTNEMKLAKLEKKVRKMLGFTKEGFKYVLFDSMGIDNSSNLFTVYKTCIIFKNNKLNLRTSNKHFNLIGNYCDLKRQINIDVP
jgi:hypothetical protein